MSGLGKPLVQQDRQGPRRGSVGWTVTGRCVGVHPGAPMSLIPGDLGWSSTLKCQLCDLGKGQHDCSEI